MKKLLTISILAAIAIGITGCGSPKVRDVDVKGIYVNGYTEVLALGRGKVTSIPSDKEALAAHYEEDTAWLSPSTKTHALDLFLVGTNTVENSADIVKSICQAFADVAPTVSSNNAAVAKGGGTIFTYFAGNHQTAANGAAKAAEALATAVDTATATNATATASGTVPDTGTDSAESK